MLRTDDLPMPELDERPSFAVDPVFRHDVVNGLAARPRAIPARWFYDRDGSALFEQITTLPEYYLTRTERTLLENAAAEIAVLVGPRRSVVEFGSGSCSKTRILLAELDPAAYVPIDISADILGESRPQTFRRYFPGCQYTPSKATLRMPYGFRLRSSACLSLDFFLVRRLAICLLLTPLICCVLWRQQQADCRIVEPGKNPD